MEKDLKILINETILAVKNLKVTKSKLENELQSVLKKMENLKEERDTLLTQLKTLELNQAASFIQSNSPIDKKNSKKEIDALIKLIDKNIATLKTDFMP
ncbi:MAG: hypothetical protein KA275_07055 [Chitinophagaceae bacterium]|nr:hypothetical protein [Chitinophagaceae bacterium]